MMQHGTVKWFSAEKGYGFIRPDANLGAEVFIHASVLEKSNLESLATGQRVAFDFATDSRGRLRAIIVSAAPEKP